MSSNDWQTINIFLSSTFSDMQAERDVVRKIVVPRLNEKLLPYRKTVTVTDLRWGIEATGLGDEAEREAKVLHVCINAIKHTRPYFVALIGERYGWIPSEDMFRRVIRQLDPEEKAIFERETSACSVTEMEILLGAIGSREMLDHSCFCFRNVESYQGMTDEDYDKFVIGNENEQASIKLLNLKAKIRRQCAEAGEMRSVFDYTCQWDSQQQKFVGLDEFARQLEERILEDLIDAEADKIISETKIFDNFFDANSHRFIGRRQKLEEVKKIILATESYAGSPLHGLILQGPSGVGKSYFLSALRAMMQDKERRIVLTHAAGLTPRSVYVDSMYGNWKEKLRDIVGEDSNDFRYLAKKAHSKGYTVIALIDSLDSFAIGEDPFADMPECVIVVATSLQESADKLVQLHQDYALMSLEDFSREDAEEMIEHMFAQNFKELTPDIKDSLLAKCTSAGGPSYSSPLWLNLALSMLMEVGDEDFRVIHKIGGDASQSIHNYLYGLINSLSGDADRLFMDFVDMTCRYFNPQLTVRVLTYIAIAPFGLEERQLQAILGDDWDALQFESLRQWFGSNIMCVGPDRILRLSHAILRTSVIESASETISGARARLNEADWHDYIDKRIDLDELLKRLIYRSEYDAVRVVATDCYEQLANRGIDNFAKSVLNVLEHDEYTVVRFVDRYFSLFNTYDIYDAELDWLNYLVEEVDRSKLSRKEALTAEFNGVKTRYLIRDKIFNGSSLDFSNFLWSESNDEARLWAIEANIGLYGYRIIAVGLYCVLSIRERAVFELRCRVTEDTSMMPEFIEKYVEAIDYANILKQSMPDHNKQISKALLTLKEYLTNCFLGWSFDSHPYHSVQVELSEKLNKIIEAPFPVAELPEFLRPTASEVAAVIREYKSRFLPTEMMEEAIIPLGVKQQLAQAEIHMIMNNKASAMEIVESVSAADKYTPPVLDWLYKRCPDSDILDEYYRNFGRFDNMMCDIMLGVKVEPEEITRIAHIYQSRGEKEVVEKMFVIASEILLLRQQNLNFEFSEYGVGYITTLEHVSSLYKSVVNGMVEIECDVKYVREVLIRWIDMCEMAYSHRPEAGAEDYEWGENMMRKLGIETPQHSHPAGICSEEIVDRISQSLSINPNGIKAIVPNGNGDVLIVKYCNEFINYAALFDAEGKPLSELDEYRYIINFRNNKFSLVKYDRYPGWLYLKRDGQIAFQKRFNMARKFSEGLAAVSGDRRSLYPECYYWGFINEEGHEAIPCIYDEVGDFHEGKAWAIKDGRYGMIDTEGNVVIDFVYDMFTSYYHGHAYAFRDGKMSVI